MRGFYVFLGIVLLIVGLIVGVTGFAGFVLATLVRGTNLTLAFCLFGAGILVGVGGLIMILRNYQRMVGSDWSIFWALTLFGIGLISLSIRFSLEDPTPIKLWVLAIL